jgi:tol-pal system protein YbgF
MKRIIYFCLLIAFVTASTSARAGTKEEVERLQKDVLTLQDMVRAFEKTYSEKIEGLRSLVMQLNDQAANSNVLLSKIAKTQEGQESGARANDQAILQEIRALSAKIDENSTQISALAHQIADLKVQSKPIVQENQGGQPSNYSPDAIFFRANQDLASGNLDVAISGFTNYLASSPAGSNAAWAQLNIGEILYMQHKLPEAIAAFTRVINDYPNSDKVASALYKRGNAELAEQESENAINDFKKLIQAYPSTDEANLAKDQLQSLGAGETKPKPAARRKR